MKVIAKLVLVLVTAAASTYAFAGFTGTPYDLVTTGSGHRTENKAYLGLKWSLNGGKTPALVLGAAHVKVKSNGNTEGANFSFTLKLAGGVKPSLIKLNYMNGKNDLQGELGLGYDFLKSAPLLGVGANAPYVNAGVDIYRHAFSPFATLTTLKKFDKPGGGSTVCTDVSGTATPGNTYYTSATCTATAVWSPVL